MCEPRRARRRLLLRRVPPHSRAGKRHALSVISFLGSHEKVRFNAIQERFAGSSSSTLAARLQELEESGLIARSAFDEQNKVEYRLTPRGRALQKALGSLFPRAR